MTDEEYKEAIKKAALESDRWILQEKEKELHEILSGEIESRLRADFEKAKVNIAIASTVGEKELLYAFETAGRVASELSHYTTHRDGTIEILEKSPSHRLFIITIEL
jgi:hypothetical protein